jgi:hypothetical protein
VKETDMAAGKTATNQGTVYSVTDPHGNLVKITQGQAAFITGTPTMVITIGGTSMALTQGNVTDLLAAFTTFSVRGVVA